MALPQKISFLFIPFLMFSSVVIADNSIWSDVAVESIQLQSRSAKQFKHRYLRADIPLLKKLMLSAPLEQVSASLSYIDLPLPDGNTVTLAIEESPILSHEQSAQNPEIKTYRVFSNDGSHVSGRLDILTTGFHAYLITAKGIVLIDPDPGAAGFYKSYYKNEKNLYQPRQFSCGVYNSPQISSLSSKGTLQKTAARNSNQLLSYRIAVAATREYSLAVTDGSGNIADTQAAIVTTINRVNAIYQRDLAIFLQLVVDDDLISTSVSDFNNNDSDAVLANSKSFIDLAIAGVGNYDIGHVFSTGAGGQARLGVVCDDALKAEGVTGIADPIGDAFDIDFVAHEIGHQFNANHTFNGTTENCSGVNRNATTAFEPGSGTTIMAYAGICGTENVQLSALSPTAGGASEDVFHAASIDEIVNFTRVGSGSACDLLTTNANTAPVADAGSDYTIPGQTPFELTASATDVDLDTLSYQWDEMDIGLSTNSASFGLDLGSNPLFRSFSPSSNPVRIFPRMSTIISGANDKAERLPDTDRTLNFRLTVRDQNRGVDDDEMRLTVDKDAGPFAVLSATSPIILDITQPQVIEWAVACTNMAPVNCANVDILLSTDSGVSFPDILLAATANDGEETVTLPAAVISTTAVIKVACSDNVFFDITDSLITLQDGTGGALVSTGAGNDNCSPGSGPGNAAQGFDISSAVYVDVRNEFIDNVSDVSNIIDVFQFTGTAEVYSFLLSGFGNSNLDLYLTDAVGNVLIQSTGINTSEIINVTLADEVIYHLIVVAENTAGTVQSYTVSSTQSAKPAVTATDSGSSALNIFLLVLMMVLRRFCRRYDFLI